MKKCGIAKLCLTLCLILGLTIVPGNRLEVQADEIIATVYGTILSGTTSELLRLSTKQGNMEIKLDSGTDTSAGKILLPGKEVSVSVSRGSDAYLHAVKITTDRPTSTATLDSSTTVTVSGTIGDKTTEELIYLKTNQGEMQIKLDPTTNLSGTPFLVLGKTYEITCARGSDAYMHAVTISDKAAATGQLGNNSAYMSVTGTVKDSTKETLLYLSTTEGEMQFVIDNSADTSSGMVLTPGRKITVYFYRGTDAYLHAAELLLEYFCIQSFRRDIEKLIVAKDTVFKRDYNFFSCHTRVDSYSLDTPVAQVAYLVFHQCDKWRDDQAKPFLSKSRHLKRDGLTSSGGHQPQRIPLLADTGDDVFLYSAEVIVSPVLFQNAFVVHLCLVFLRSLL